MNTKILIGLLAIGLLAPTAAAVGGDLGGLVRADAESKAHADYSGALDAVGDAEDQLEAEARAAIEGATKTATTNKANAEYTLDYQVDQGMTSSSGAKTGILAGIAQNLESFGAWATSLYVKPSADLKHTSDVEGVLGVIGDAANNDGSLDVGAAESAEGLGHVDYNMPPPPKPDVGFVQSIKIAFSALFELA